MWIEQNIKSKNTHILQYLFPSNQKYVLKSAIKKYPNHFVYFKHYCGESY